MTLSTVRSQLRPARLLEREQLFKRIHAFLVRFGCINYGVIRQANPNPKPNGYVDLIIMLNSTWLFELEIFADSKWW